MRRRILIPIMLFVLTGCAARIANRTPREVATVYLLTLAETTDRLTDTAIQMNKEKVLDDGATKTVLTAMDRVAASGQKAVTLARALDFSQGYAGVMSEIITTIDQTLNGLPKNERVTELRTILLLMRTAADTARVYGEVTRGQN